MKTAKSFTKRKLDNEINLFIGRIRDFTYSELYNILLTAKDPLIYEIGSNEFILGRYILVREGQLWKVLTYMGDVEHVFQTKMSAIVYSYLLMKNNLNLAKNVADADDRVLYSKAEMDLYRGRLQDKSSKIDDFRYELYAAKYTDSRIKYNIAKEELEKTLKMAKYLKLGT